MNVYNGISWFWSLRKLLMCFEGTNWAHEWNPSDPQNPQHTTTFKNPHKLIKKWIYFILEMFFKQRTVGTVIQYCTNTQYMDCIANAFLSIFHTRCLTNLSLIDISVLSSMSPMWKPTFGDMVFSAQVPKNRLNHSN